MCEFTGENTPGHETLRLLGNAAPGVVEVGSLCLKRLPAKSAQDCSDKDEVVKMRTRLQRELGLHFEMLINRAKN